MIKPLPKELQDKAIKVLNEDPNRVEEDIARIKEWMRQQPHLNGREDDQWILGFLRGCKFSLELTKTKLDNFYSLKSLWSEFVVCRDPFSREIQEILKLELGIPLPKPANSTGPTVIMSHINKLNLDLISMDSIISTIFMSNGISLLEDPNYVVSGVIYLMDMKGSPRNPMAHITPTIVKKLSFALKNAVPVRVKAIVFFNMPPIFDWLINLVKSFLPKKLQDRIFSYSELDIPDLEQYVSKKYLPKEYGGENASLDELRENWKKRVESYADWFKEDIKYCTNESLRPGKSVVQDYLGIEGSFRKLNVD